MRIVFLAPANNYHTKKWCSYFASHNYELHVISFFDGEIPNAKVHFIDCSADAGQSDGCKLKYLLQAHRVRKLVMQLQPDIISVHYATSYGTVAALAGLKNYFLSVWGSDVYDFPRKSIVHRWMVKYSLARAKYLLSTSAAMRTETQKYTNKPIAVTPFGVDTNLFSPQKRTRAVDDGVLVLGTVKALDPKYGIDVLLKAVAIVCRKYPQLPIRLRIAGKGAYREKYEQLAKTLGIENITTWLGFISQEEAAREWANMDIAVVASTMDSESFGVSAIEAEASQTPVIISDIPGLMEATSPDITSCVVPRSDEYALAEAIATLCVNADRRIDMGKAGRQWVLDNYGYEYCFSNIERFFLEALKKQEK